MLYGRLNDNNTIAEIIDQDPTGRYPDAIQWVAIPDDFGLLSTKDKNSFLKEVRREQASSTAGDFESLKKMQEVLMDMNNFVDHEKEKLAVAGIDIDAAYNEWVLAQNSSEEEEAVEEE